MLLFKKKEKAYYSFKYQYSKKKSFLNKINNSLLRAFRQDRIVEGSNCRNVEVSKCRSVELSNYRRGKLSKSQIKFPKNKKYRILVFRRRIGEIN